MSIRFRLTIVAIAVILIANSLLSFITLQYLGRVWMGEVQTRVRRNLNSARAAYLDRVDVIAAFLRATARGQTLAAAAAPDRAGPRRPGQSSGLDVLLYLLGLGRAADSGDVCRAVVDRGDLREQQAVAGPGRRGQPQREGRAAHCADGACVVQPDCPLVSQDGPSSSSVSRSSLVPSQVRTLVRRHAHHPAAAELAGQNPHTAPEKQTREKDSCPACRVPQPFRLTSCSPPPATSIDAKTRPTTAVQPTAVGRNYV